MLEGVSVVCFSACYLIALILEIARLRFVRKAKILSGVAFVTTLAGVVAHAAFLYYNDLLQNDHFFASAGGWFSVLAFTVVLVEIYLAIVSKTQFSLFLLPLALILTGVSLRAGNVAFTPSATCLWVRATHGVSLLLTTLIAFVGAVCGGMYFWQHARLRKHIAESLLSLPSLEWLSRGCRFAANTSVVTLGIGVASGFYLKVFSGAQSHADFAAVGTSILFVVALLARFPKRRARARDVCAINAWHNLVVCAAMAVFLFFAAFGPGSHWRSLTDYSSDSYEIQESDEMHAEDLPSK
ncbi:MAG: hypothetical protein ACOX0A_05060 [Thermoguttaceae bacterium]|jgi:hypothetical protein